RAAELFEDPEWRAAAQYRAGDYEASAATLAGLDTATAHYNRGNALARAGELRAAIAAYDRALELDPDHEDARYNRDLLQELLEQNPPPPPQQQQQSSASDQENAEQSQGESSDAPQQAQNGEGSTEGQEQSPQQQSAESQPSESEPGAEGQQGDGDEEQLASAEPGEQSEDGESEADGEPEDAESEAADAEGNPMASEDLERWASDQAAEQWLRRIRQDPGGLLRRKFLYQYQRLGIDQDGRYTRAGDEVEPWGARRCVMRQSLCCGSERKSTRLNSSHRKIA